MFGILLRLTAGTMSVTRFAASRVRHLVDYGLPRSHITCERHEGTLRVFPAARHGRSLAVSRLQDITAWVTIPCFAELPAQRLTLSGFTAQSFSGGPSGVDHEMQSCPPR